MSERDLPAGMVPASGAFRYEADEFGIVELEVSHAQFTLWKTFRGAEEEPGVQLNIMVASLPRMTPAGVATRIWPTISPRRSRWNG